MIELTILGSGNHNPFADMHACPAKPKRNPPMFLVEDKVAGQMTIRIMLDFGSGALRRLADAKIHPTELDAVCITHPHPDHIADVMSLAIIHTESAKADESSLVFFGPRDFQNRFEKLKQSFWVDDFPMPCFQFNLCFGACRYGLKKIQIESFDTRHRTNHVDSLSVGYIIEANGKKLVYTGDIGPHQDPSFFQAIDGADVLLIEAGAKSADSLTHITAGQAIAWGQSFNAKKTVLFHMDSTMAETAQQLVAKENGRDLPGQEKFFVAHDGQKFCL